MLALLVSKLVTNVFGLLYPAYLSFVAVKNKDVRGYVQWMMYWIVYAFYSFFESFSDTLVGPWFPFYYETKIVFLIWLMSPTTRGANVIYRRFVHPNLLKYEPEIDLHIASVKERLGSVFWTWAGRLLHRAQEAITDTIWHTAIRVRENDFMRRAVSLHGLEHEQYQGDHRATRSVDASPSAGEMDLDNYISERMKRDMFLQRNMGVRERMMESDDGLADPDFKIEEVEDQEMHDDDSPPSAAVVNAPRTRSRRKKENNNGYETAPRARKPRKQVITPRTE